MNIIEELEKIYNEIDLDYSNKEFEARSKGYNRKEESYQNIRSINDHAYFLLAFTRLEDRIKAIARDLIKEKVSSLTSWSHKRVWIIIKKREDNDNLYFLEYVELLTEKGKSDYNLIQSYYKDRNDVAHGGLLSSINMIKVFEDFKRLFKELAT